MLGNPDLGPECPVCSSGEWEFTDFDMFTETGDRQPKHRVTVRADCDDCDSKFDIDLRLDDDSMFQKYNIQSVSPPQGFGWGSVPSTSQSNDILHVWGNMNDGRGSQYSEKYILRNITVIENNL
jgi:hypothetical protein